MSDLFDSTFFFVPGAVPAFSTARFSHAIETVRQQVSNAYGHDIKIITPMGLEIFQDIMILDRPFRRFYIYLYSEKPYCNAQEIEEKFINDFYNLCADLDPLFHSSIAVLAARTGLHNLKREKNHIWNTKDRLVVAEFRDTLLPPLVDYATYLLACVDAILGNQITETQRFWDRRMARARVYQLALIACHVLENLLQEQFFDSSYKEAILAYRALPHFYYQPDRKEEADATDQQNFQAVIAALAKARFALSVRTSAKNSINLCVKAMHGDMTLRFLIPEDIYLQFTDVVTRSYQKFWFHS